MLPMLTDLGQYVSRPILRIHRIWHPAIQMWRGDWMRLKLTRPLILTSLSLPEQRNPAWDSVPRRPVLRHHLHGGRRAYRRYARQGRRGGG